MCIAKPMKRNLAVEVMCGVEPVAGGKDPSLVLELTK